MKIKDRSENYNFQEKGVAIAGSDQKIFIFVWGVHHNAPLYYGKSCLRSVISMFFLEAADWFLLIFFHEVALFYHLRTDRV